MIEKVYRMSAFAAADNGGNPAGVVFEADHLTEERMKEIAAEVGYSETAFVMKSDLADFKVRFFTPTEEVDLCGHATIATFNLMRDQGLVKPGQYTQETKAGVLKLRVYEDSVFMEQTLPEFYEIIPKDQVSDCFSIGDGEYLGDSDVQIVSTGLKDIMLPVNDLDTLLKMKPDFEKITEISKKYDVVGIHAFALDTYGDGTAHTRNFAPLYGIDEESATGTSNCALACYLDKGGNEGVEGRYVFEQGYCMDSPSEIRVELVKDKEGKLSGVYVGGKATRVKQDN